MKSRHVLVARPFVSTVATAIPRSITVIRRWEPNMDELVAHNINIRASMWMLLTTDADGEIIASEYAKHAKAAGLILSLGPLNAHLFVDGGGCIIKPEATNNDGDMMEALHVLAKNGRARRVFGLAGNSDGYANCMGL